MKISAKYLKDKFLGTNGLKFSMPEKLEQENPDHKLEIGPENPDLLGHGGRISTFLCMKS
jgi:hypothetical protein